ncbi:MAG: transglycosylase domain-containing protein [Deltaproteobacteria bacterium]|nr:transglycosylase domain-containing protein [Deltaproteobacteria bacterium]
MKFIKNRRVSILIILLCLITFILLLPSVVVKLYLNTDSFKRKIASEIDRRIRFDNLSFSYKLGDIGLFSGVEFLEMRLLYRNSSLAELRDCHLWGIEKKLIFRKNSFFINCGRGIVDLELLEKIKGQEKKIHQKDSYGNYDITMKVHELKLVYRKIPFEVKLVGRYSLKDKYVEVELKDKYKMRIEDIDLGSRSAKIAFINVDIPFLLDRYLNKYSGLISGRLTGYVTVRKKGDEIEFEFNDASVSNMYISHPFIGERPFEIKRFLLNGKVLFSVALEMIRLDEININVSEMNLVLSGRIVRGDYFINLESKKFELNDIAAFFGGEDFKDFNMKGEIKVKISISGNINRVKKINNVSINGEVIKPIQISKRFDYLRSDFSFEFVGRNGKKRKIIIGQKNPDYVSLVDIPRSVYGAIVVSEDAGFFGHKGVEFKEIESAIIDNVGSDRPYLRGGSTITQQLVKNLLLTKEKTLIRKAKELLLAIELDATLSKERILEIYLNGIEWGPDIFGIAAASRHYFGKYPSELKASEAAYLASIIPNPNRFYVYYIKNEIPDKWIERVQNILYRMNMFGYLTDDEYNGALSEKITFERTINQR